MSPAPIWLWGPVWFILPAAWPLSSSAPAARSRCAAAGHSLSLPRPVAGPGGDTQQRSGSRSITPWHPAGPAATAPASPALETRGDYTPTHNCGTGSTSAECILQADTPQTPQCPCSDIGRLQTASHLLCLDRLPPSGRFWPELLSGMGVGIARAPHWLRGHWNIHLRMDPGGTGSGFRAWTRCLESLANYGFPAISKSCPKHNKIELKKRNIF